MNQSAALEDTATRESNNDNVSSLALGNIMTNLFFSPWMAHPIGN
jgi:hypothetical protein